jgi:hypothetical protein
VNLHYLKRSGWLTTGASGCRSERYDGDGNECQMLATSYRLKDRGIGVRVPVVSRIFISPVLGHTQLLVMGKGGSFPEAKRQEREADRLPP